MTKICWNWDRTPDSAGENGAAPGSWKIIVMTSLPMCRFRSTCCLFTKMKMFYFLILGLGQGISGPEGVLGLPLEKGSIVETWNMI